MEKKYITTDADIQPKMNLKTNLIIIFIIIIIILLALAITFIALYAHEKNKTKDKDNNINNNGTMITKELSLWNDREPKNILINFMKSITDESNIDFILKEDRIAVFDFDGTLFQETDPIYLDHKLFLYRVFNDTNYKDKATEKEISAANYIKEYADKGTLPPLELINAEAMAEVYKDMKLKELYDYTKNYIDQPSDGYYNMKRGEAFYKPMLELIDFLQRNDFKVYVLTGTDTFITRAIIDGHINIPENQIIGTETKIISDNQDDKSGLEYKYNRNDSLKFKGELINKNLNMNKVYYIMKEIGKLPILSFGNSGSDSSMAELAMQHPNGLAFMILCDDLERERGDLDKAQSFEKSCNDNNYITISMRDDWKTIYGDKVTRKKR